MANNLLDTLPFTEEGAKLALTEEQEKDCKLVYKLNEAGDALFDGFWDPGKEYSDEFIIVPLRSVYGGITLPMQINTDFANIIGSSHDPCPSRSWVELLRTALGAAAVTTCCTDGNIYEARNVTIGVCGGGIVGGHIILGQVTDSPPINSRVYLLPICSNHNVKTPRTPGIYYMKLGRSMSAVILNHYLRSGDIQTALRLKREAVSPDAAQPSEAADLSGDRIEV